MPLIEFETGKDEGAYLLVTSGEVGWFPDGVFGVTEQLLQQLGPRFQAKGIRYHCLSQEEANRLAKSGSHTHGLRTIIPLGTPKRRSDHACLFQRLAGTHRGCRRSRRLFAPPTRL